MASGEQSSRNSNLGRVLFSSRPKLPRSKKGGGVDTSLLAIQQRLKADLEAESLQQKRQKELHLERLEKMRKLVNEIKQTEWMYEPIEKLIGLQ